MESIFYRKLNFIENTKQTKIGVLWLGWGCPGSLPVDTDGLALGSQLSLNPDQPCTIRKVSMPF